MNLVSYSDGSQFLYGVVTDSGPGQGIVTADQAFRDRFPTLKAVLEGDALAALRDHVADRPPDRALDQVDYLPPVHDAGNVICIGINYPKRHPLDGFVPPPEQVIIFGKFQGSLVGHNRSLAYPPAPACETFDYEGELALVIGKAGRHIAKEEAFAHIAGYTILNDGSVREWQKHSLQAGKNFHASGACGPWMVTADEIEDVGAMRLSTRLNGVEVQSTTVAEMIFDIPTLIHYVSNLIELIPGDIISTGSPEGSGASRTPQRFLQIGDVVEVEWSGIGVLRNAVEASC